MRRVLIPSFAAWLIIVGCGGAQPASGPPPSPPGAPPSTTIVSDSAPVEPPPLVTHAPPPAANGPPPWAELPRWHRRLSGIEPEDPTAPGNAAPGRTLEAAGRKSDYWSPCVRAFVQLQPVAARELLGDALSLYSTTCSATRVEFRVPHTRRSTRLQSQVGLVGALEGASRELALRVAYHGEPLGAERITLIADGVRWSSPRIDFDPEVGGEVALLPFTRTVARVVRRALDARDALLRVEGPSHFEDIVLGDDLKQELQVMLDALDARDLAAPAGPAPDRGAPGSAP